MEPRTSNYKRTLSNALSRESFEIERRSAQNLRANRSDNNENDDHDHQMYEEEGHFNFGDNHTDFNFDCGSAQKQNTDDSNSDDDAENEETTNHEMINSDDSTGSGSEFTDDNRECTNNDEQHYDFGNDLGYDNDEEDSFSDFDDEEDIAQRGQMAAMFAEMDLNDGNDDEREDVKSQSYIHPSSKVTVQDFGKKYTQIEAYNSIKRSASNSTFTLLHNSIPDIKLPTKQLSDGTYVFCPEQSDIGTAHVDVCRRGCMCYLNSYAKQINCKFCGASRFHVCRQHKCTNKQCNPFINGKGNHSLARRFPKRTAYYRSLIILLKELVKHSVNSQLKEQNSGANNNSSTVYDFAILHQDENTEKGTELFDIKDSECAREHLEAMRSNYLKHEEKKNAEESKDSRLKTEEFSFILSVFYDSGNLANRAARSLWPLVITVLNANPHLRVQPGIAMFLIMLHDLAVGCNAEQTLFKDIFVPELNILNDGLLFDFVDNTGASRRAFIQARLVSHNYDTPALQDVFHLQGA